MTRRKTILIYIIVLMLPLLLAAGCTKKDDRKGEEKAEVMQLTAYSQNSEVFMEFAEPVAGEKTRFLIHLTRLADWKPATEGGMRLVFTPQTGNAATFTLPAPIKPGIYQADVTLAAAGEYALTIVSEGKGFADTIAIPEVHVIRKGEEHKHGHDEAKGKNAEKPHAEHADEHKDGKHAEDKHDDEHAGEKHAAHEEDHDEKKHGEHEKEGHSAAGVRVVAGTGGGTIAFPKAQQWNVDFATRPAEKKTLTTYATTMGELVPVSNAEATVSAPLAGIVSGSRSLPYIGKRVAKGEVVAVIEPPIRQEGGIGQLSAGYAEAKNRVALAQKEYERAKRLYEAKIAPLKRVEEAELSLSSAKAALEPLEKALGTVRGEGGSGRISVRAPVGGTVVEVQASNGKGVEAGQALVRIINTSTVWLKANLPATDAGKAALAAGAVFSVTGLEGEFKPSRLVTVGDMLDPQTRTLPVIFEVPNPGGRLKVGMFANVSIRTGEAKDALAVPKEALAEDEGRWFLFIQTSGQTFERREVKIGAQDKGYVHIVEGLKPEERVVVKGAYYVKLAATAGKAADPHAGHNH